MNISLIMRLIITLIVFQCGDDGDAGGHGGGGDARRIAAWRRSGMTTWGSWAATGATTTRACEPRRHPCAALCWERCATPGGGAAGSEASEASEASERAGASGASDETTGDDGGDFRARVHRSRGGKRRRGSLGMSAALRRRRPVGIDRERWPRGQRDAGHRSGATSPGVSSLPATTWTLRWATILGQEFSVIAPT